jgi:hypothetical protein
MLDSELIVSGPRKRKETSRVTENADPLLKKKLKLGPKAPALQQPIKPKSNKKTLRRPPSVEIEDVSDDEDTVQHPSLKNPNHIIEAADGSDDKDPDDDIAPDLMDVDDDDEEEHEESEKELEESAEDELRESLANMNELFPHLPQRV